MKSFTRTKLLALLVVGMLAIAGMAFADAVAPDGVVGTGTTNVTDYEYDDYDVDNFFEGTGLFSGRIIADDDVDPADAGGAAKLFIRTPLNGVLTFAPAANNYFGQSIFPGGGAEAVAVAGTGLAQLSVNPMPLRDGDPDYRGTPSAGNIVLHAANADAPTVAAFNNYAGGTYLRSGTLTITHDNSLGLLGLVLLGNRTGNTTLNMADNDKVILGFMDRNNKATFQPVYLAYEDTADGANATVGTTINVGTNGDNLQTLQLDHGIRQGLYTETDGDDPNQGDPVAADTIEDAFGAFVRLTKTGAGNLFIGSEGSPNTIAALADYPYRAYAGANHAGGTSVLGGGLEVHGGVAATTADRYKGSLGWTWPMDNDFNNEIDDADGNYVENYLHETFGDPDGGGAYEAINGALHNPLEVRNDGRVVVNRTQFFTFFNGDATAQFTANQFSRGGTNERPEIVVQLAQNDSTFDGLMTGSFDLVLRSMPLELPNNLYDPTAPMVAPNLPNLSAMLNAPDAAPEIQNPAQGYLTLGNAENQITGITRVVNGVLAVAGAHSIPNGALRVGANGADEDDDNDAGYNTFNTGLAQNMGVFLGLNEATFVNPTTVKAGGALAAARGARTTYHDVTVDGGITINPRTVGNWGQFDYPNWTGTVTFGATSADTYTLTGNDRNRTNVNIARGILHLGSYPADGYMNTTIAQSAVLSLGRDVNDFTNTMDLTINDDSRIRVVLRPTDLYNSRSEAMQNPAVFTAAEIDYSALLQGEANRNRRLDIQLDLSGVGQSLTAGQWVKLVYSPDAIDWSSLNFLREDSTTQYEDYAKVRITYMDSTDIVVPAVAHLDRNSYTILMEVTADYNADVPGGQQPQNPVDASMVTLGEGVPTELAASADVNIPFTINPVSYDVTTVALATPPTPATWTLVPAADVATSGAFSITGVMPNAAASYSVTATSLADGQTYQSASYPVTLPGTTPPATTGSSGGGCDAGFGAFALIAAAGALVLRKKD